MNKFLLMIVPFFLTGCGPINPEHEQTPIPEPGKDKYADYGAF